MNIFPSLCHSNLIRCRIFSFRSFFLSNILTCNIPTILDFSTNSYRIYNTKNTIIKNYYTIIFIIILTNIEWFLNKRFLYLNFFTNIVKYFYKYPNIENFIKRIRRKWSTLADNRQSSLKNFPGVKDPPFLPKQEIPHRERSNEKCSSFSSSFFRSNFSLRFPSSSPTPPSLESILSTRRVSAWATLPSLAFLKRIGRREEQTEGNESIEWNSGNRIPPLLPPFFPRGVSFFIDRWVGSRARQEALRVGEPRRRGISGIKIGEKQAREFKKLFESVLLFFCFVFVLFFFWRIKEMEINWLA